MSPADAKHKPVPLPPIPHFEEFGENPDRFMRQLFPRRHFMRDKAARSCLERRYSDWLRLPQMCTEQIERTIKGVHLDITLRSFGRDERVSAVLTQIYQAMGAFLNDPKRLPPPPEPKPPTLGFVYFVRTGDFVKIGFTRNVEERIFSLQAASPTELTLVHSMPGALDEEGALHKRFKHLRERREWFKAEPELVAFIEELRCPAALLS